MKTPILIVDDDPAIRELMDLTLSQAGYEVATVPSGEAALDLMKRSRFELMLLDVHMPRMSGLDLMAAMKRLAKAPLVLMVTADGQMGTVRKAVALGCVGYVAKPFRPSALVERVSRALAPAPEAVLI